MEQKKNFGFSPIATWILDFYQPAADHFFNGGGGEIVRCEEKYDKRMLTLPKNKAF